VSGIVECSFDAVTQRDVRSIVDRREKGKGSLSIGGGVEWDFREGALSFLPFVPLSLELGIFFLKMGGVEKYYLSNFRGGGSTVYPAPKTIGHQLGKQAAVVYVGVGQKYGIQGGGRDGKRLPVPVGELSFLVEAAVNQKLKAVDFQKVLRTGDILYPAQEPQLDLQNLSPDCLTLYIISPR
jgi:hypothetical protein